MIPPPRISPLFPYTTLSRSANVLVPGRRRPLAQVGRAAHARAGVDDVWRLGRGSGGRAETAARSSSEAPRSEEHTSELQSLNHLVCRLLLVIKECRVQRHIH